jgi:hypothetical protein
MIESRPKILRLGDKSDPFMFAVNCGAGIIESQPVFSQRTSAVSRSSEWYPTVKSKTRTCGNADFAAHR